jgi:hypothetical protein
VTTRHARQRYIFRYTCFFSIKIAYLCNNLAFLELLYIIMSEVNEVKGSSLTP